MKSLSLSALAICFLLFCNMHVTAQDQSVSINSASGRVNSKNYKGFSSIINGPVSAVEDSWLAHVWDLGKVRRKRNFYRVSELPFSDKALDSTLVYTRVTSTADSTGRIWVGLDDGSIDEENLDALNKDLSIFLENYSYQYYREVVQKQIDESERAAQFQSKKHQKLISDGNRLDLNLTDSKAQKVRLQELIEKATLDIANLEQLIGTNKTDVEQAYQDLEKIKSVVEAHKAKLKTMN